MEKKINKQRKVSLPEFLWLMIRHANFKDRYIDFNLLRRQEWKQLASEIGVDPGNSSHILPSPHPILRVSKGSLAFLANYRNHYRRFFVVPSEKLVYLRIFKNGSTSMLTSLLPLMLPELKSIILDQAQLEAAAHFLQRDVLTEKEKEYDLFTIVRDPFERLVSSYLDVFNPNHPFGYGDFLFGILQPSMLFEELIDILEKIPDRFRGPHFASQHTIISISLPTTKVKIYKLEEAKMDAFLETHALHVNHLNKSNFYNYKAFYTPELAHRVYQLYYNDITQYGYEEIYEKLQTSLSVNEPIVESTQV